MKKFSRDPAVSVQIQVKLVVYLSLILLSIAFGLLSLGMLSPFMNILFPGDNPQQAKVSTNAIGP